MKKLFLFVALIATAFTQKSFAQDTTNQTQLSQLLNSYYQVKNALIEGNSNTAALQAEAFLKTANGISNRTISEGSRNALVKDAGVISESKDLKKQREVFANFSTNMYALAKSLKLTEEPIYYQYCPMKKAYWLSSDKAIKNPYYGSVMLTCGSVKETIE
jgi:DNA-binding transcriptional regulator WhiA